MPAQRVTVTEKIAEANNADVSDAELYYVKIVQPPVMIDTHELWNSTLTVV